jgi:hypothetical protein
MSDVLPNDIVALLLRVLDDIKTLATEAFDAEVANERTDNGSTSGPHSMVRRYAAARREERNFSHLNKTAVVGISAEL